ncbi:hypothetical protein AAHA92_25333 [Salvia divinorum]|uniref:Ubiquitin-like protease family profile domain-containing protein n=1 Tax=Salvia divinorum TaxID=28513 RepID=A0ABD1GA98_SALDI
MTSVKEKWSSSVKEKDSAEEPNQLQTDKSELTDGESLDLKGKAPQNLEKGKDKATSSTAQPKKIVKQVKKSNMQGNKKMKLKRGPREFVDMMKSLTKEQLAAVEEMGFGKLIHFDITAIPAKLAYALLESFDQATCSIKLHRGTLHISEEDVYVTLGLPQGEMKIRRSGRQSSHDFLDELAEAGSLNRNNMGPKYLIKQLMKDKGGGEWFRKVFIIIVDTILFAPSADGYCKTHIMEYIDHIAEVRNYNWCGYVLDMLVFAHDTWRLNTSTPFTGPISFLVVCYVDRIVYKTRLVSRRFPTIKGWTAALLRRRQALEINTGQFGKGCKEPIADPIRLEAQYKSPTQVCVTAEAQELEDDVYKSAHGPTFSLGFGFGKKSEDNITTSGMNGIVFINSDSACKEKDEHVDDVPKDVDLQAEIKSAINAYIEMGDDPEFMTLAMNNTTNRVDDVKAQIKSAMNAFMQIGDDDFMSSPVNNKATQKLGTQLVVYDKENRVGKGRMEVRSRSELKISLALRSPFNERMVKIQSKLSIEEKHAYYWILTTSHMNENTLVYDDDVVQVTKLEFCSLIPRKLIEVGVINAWGSYLNNMEEFRAPSSPKRLFFTTYPCLYTIVTKPASVDVKMLITTFGNNLDNEVKEIPNFKWAETDMVFFPICSNEHYYLVCFFLNRSSIVILDNSKNGDDNDLTKNYGDIPETLRLFFCRYMTTTGLHAQCKYVIKSKIERLKMNWRTKDNVEDCGVFLMRHMESYMGQRLQDWKCGLSVRSKNKLQRLRAKYCGALMNAGNNHEYFNNKKSTTSHYENDSKYMKIDVEKMITD